ncbi:CHAT domain-containing protein [Coleofasciculus sp. FACHB-64]|uniref:CHAT domain-containing protein n=1 Tax=Cyanophyceae TaxID=3028117 RepID=UPI001687501E|nr:MULTISPECIES: CHAT domain-containing tetratricopeptide repeat protein [unclassified Coleofasciculus]MBD1840517.1 CHAT domain-containing protein [Coleofasciculus sp. FACHB-501]MBD2046918.1 CHAT domain-containing protein [Coleofasciculus sp. FACHB-64]
MKIFLSYFLLLFPQKQEKLNSQKGFYLFWAAVLSLLASFYLLPPLSAASERENILKNSQAQGDEDFISGVRASVRKSLQTAGTEKAAITKQVVKPDPVTIDNRSQISDRQSASEFNADKLLQLGIRQHQTGQFQEALKSLQRSLKLYQEIGSRTGEANVLLNIGETYFTLGQYLRSLAFYYQTLDILQGIGDQPGAAKVLDNLGNAYFYLGDEKQAKDFRDAAQKLRQEIGNPKREAAFLGNVGIAHESEGEYPEAIALYKEQLATARESRNPNAVLDSLNNLAEAYRTLGQYPEAIDFYQQQLLIARKSGNVTEEGYFLNSIADAFEAQGQYPEAIEVRRQQVAIAQKSGDAALQLIALNNLAKTYQNAGQFEQAIALYQEPLEAARKTGDRLAEGTALNNLAFALLKSGKPEEAKETLLNSVKTWDAIRANLGSTNRYLDAQTTTYQRLQQVLIAQKQPIAALEMAEQGRIRSIVDLLRLRLSTEPVGSGLKPAPKKLTFPTIEEIKKIAKQENATLVEYSIIPDEGLYVWVIPPSGEVTFRRIELGAQNTIFPVSSIENVIAKIPESLGLQAPANPPKPRATEPAPAGNATSSPAKAPIIQPKPLLQLHQLLIKPIADLLPEDPNARVIFIPQKEMFRIPFAALVDVYGNSLIDKHTILTAPAIQVLALTKEQRGKTSGGNRLVVGNPVMPRIAPALGQAPKALPPLANAEQQALEIADFLKTKSLLIGNQATKAAVLEQMRKAKSVHLGTYAILDDVKRQGVPGAIALSPGGSDNGLLTSAEILESFAQPKGQHLRPELVVFTAVENGKGKTTGDGVIGLSTSLIAAGVPTAIVPLWSAPDAPTGALMSEFYKQLKQNDDKAKALRQAMLKIKQQNPNPKDWAGFTLIGEPR